ncbi:MAG: tRNA pseudouridine(38-40) synthase TruA [Actinomycetota bacterium]
MERRRGERLRRPGRRPDQDEARGRRPLNLRLDLAYHGAPFHGFARQRDVRTVQGDAEDALEQLLGVPVRTSAAGRTDTGVHALGQVINAPHAPDDLDLDKIRDAFNSMCGPHLAATSCTAAPADFDARFSALSRTYVYAILNRPVPDPFAAGTSLFHPGPLDLDAMNEACGHLVGPHDFISFGRVSEPGAPSERNLYELRCTERGGFVSVVARANAFIQQMVRSVVGTLVQVGEGRRSPDEMPGVLEARDRAAAGPVAPPHGLCLLTVEYGSGWSGPSAV